MTTMTKDTLEKPRAIPRRIWVTLEAPEIIELKRIGMDRDGEGAVAFFRDLLAPGVRAAARQRGVALDLLAEDGNDERIPG